MKLVNVLVASSLILSLVVGSAGLASADAGHFETDEGEYTKCPKGKKRTAKALVGIGVPALIFPAVGATLVGLGSARLRRHKRAEKVSACQYRPKLQRAAAAN